jgi:heat shock protein HslJ
MSKQYFFPTLSILFLGVVLLVAMCSATWAGGMPDIEDITDGIWKWHQSLYNNDQKSVPSDPSRYTVSFNPDGTLNLRADCNRGGGTFSADGKRITIEVTHTTRAMCPPESLEQTFIKDLNASNIFFFSDGNLYIDLKYHKGTMKLGR